MFKDPYNVSYDEKCAIVEPEYVQDTRNQSSYRSNKQKSCCDLRFKRIECS